MVFWISFCSSLEFYTPLFHSLLFTSVHLIPIKIIRHNCSESIFCLLLAGESETRMAPGRRNETEVLPICVEAEVLAVPRPLESKVQCLPEAPTWVLYLVSSLPSVPMCVSRIGAPKWGWGMHLWTGNYKALFRVCTWGVSLGRGLEWSCLSLWVRLGN